MRVKFWGTRGSVPTPGRTTEKFGGNTACVEIFEGDERLILDAGTGIRKLGKELMEGPFQGGRGVCHLLISHTHWDHIQGLPFFAPLYVEGNTVHIYARQRDVHLKTIFCNQTEDPYFPVGLEEVSAQVSYTELRDRSVFDIEGFRISSAPLNHPYIALGYRLDIEGSAVAYISDTAPFSTILLEHEYVPVKPDMDTPPPDLDSSKLAAMRQSVEDLCRACDLVIYDTMFRMEEYLTFPHWGHSSPEHALEIVEAAGAKRLVLYHHAPNRSDEEIDNDLAEVRKRTSVEVLAAAEGLELELSDGRLEVLR